MNQDKIKQAFKDKMQKTFALPQNEKQMETCGQMGELWLAACEWLMSQATYDFEQAWQSCGYEHSSRCNSHAVNDFKQGFQAARLSCAKELAELEKMDADKGAMLQAQNLEIASLNLQLEELKRVKSGHILSTGNFRKEIEEKDARIKKLEFMIENGLGWEDMKNDISHPNG